MPFCRTKSGTLRLVWEGEEILLDANGRELHPALAADIRNHVNVVVEEKPASPPTPAPPPAPARTSPPTRRRFAARAEDDE